MFVVKRKSDGLYFRNLGYHGRHARRWKIMNEMGLNYQTDPTPVIVNWTDKLEEVKPFKSVGGCKQAVRTGRVIGTQWVKTPFEELFEIIEVKVEIKEK